MKSKNVDEVLALIKSAECSLDNAQRKLSELQTESITKQIDEVKRLLDRCREIGSAIARNKGRLLARIVEIGLCLPNAPRFDKLGKTKLDYWIKKNPQGPLGIPNTEFINVTTSHGRLGGPIQCSVDDFVQMSRPSREERVDFDAFCQAVLNEGLKYLEGYSKSHSKEAEELGKLIKELEVALQQKTVQVSPSAK